MTEPFWMKRLTRLALAGALAGLPGIALSQSAPDSRPMVLRVRPSGYDTEQSEAQMRQERLLRKLEKTLAAVTEAPAGGKTETAE